MIAKMFDKKCLIPLLKNGTSLFIQGGGVPP
jgi:hypothetical protein